ncbi:UbiX family decarboxylase associated with menaquinone via futalosine [Methanosarcina siciliae C2J]|uniref:Flavin prenyltransferase UbiX n=3 Tax=Methanosarcina siciliae TaxID=38027 RepID=A0A0E3PCL5_9EURY|nr:UbiX family flavin prenyltransferase [Methanosarcina siciliae]AKB27350.1 UbiX family decarboxylase associated with menaquinone via futalosine [Methanosarcina siciliae T4/M]AKB31290.1 UbiX family decarboxylase associated with menaquinone via futalosine [Methanosarcina siciliae HI350]AKB35247.1 UbiX family decarboxylase associated with menaquinone via futalosine [Methanosarcina siciliae C2J]
MEIIVGISGASGVQYGIRLLEVMEEKGIETHLVLTEAAKQIIEIETDYLPLEVEKLATWNYSQKDFSAPIASGSYKTTGMVIAPCSMKTLGAVANGISDTLLTRAADVCLKEERKLVLMTRETPLNLIHLENMLKAKRAGASILPACPGFYSRPKTLEDLIDTMAGRALDLLGVENEIYRRWE